MPLSTMRLRKVFGFRLSARAAGALGLILAAFGPVRTESAVANGDSRTIYLHHIHTGENIAVTFRRDGQYDSAGLRQLNHFLRDWRNNDEINMDPRLFDVVWETYRESGSHDPIQIVSAYRSPATNSMLRRRTMGVAEHSQHMLGKAMDMHYVDVPMWKIREIGMRLERGGVGYYPTSGIPFVHLDVGHVRYWPRMSYTQLAQVFPDGKAVFKATDGRVLPRYSEALAEVTSRNGRGADESVASQSASPGPSLFSSLFGWSKTDHSRSPVVAEAAPSRPAQRAPIRPRVQLASARPDDDAQAAEGAVSSAPTPPERPSSLDARAIFAAPAVIASASSAPTPPERPISLSAHAVFAAPAVIASGPDAPLPPVRPVQFAAAGGHGSQRLNLPSVITEGGNGARQPAATGLLAYASAEPSDHAFISRDSSSLVQKKTPSVETAKSALRAANAPMVAGRLDRSNFRGLTASRNLAHSEIRSAFGSTVMPMRAAARFDLVSLAFSPEALCPARFRHDVPGPSTAAFLGKAVQPMRTFASLTD